MNVMLGARWDDPAQDDRFHNALEMGLIDYVEVNYPIPFDVDPAALELPILIHSSSNPVSSAFGVNAAPAKLVKTGADAADAPWIGEHLSWLGSAPSGSLGYQINPLFTPEFEAVTVENARRLKDFYCRPLALELGPIYLPATGCESEMHFLGSVAEDADTQVILDVTHWQIANRNLGRPLGYGLDAIDPARIVELHVAGMRCGSDGRFWHDAHEMAPSGEVLEITRRLVSDLPAVRAVTLEHDPGAPKDDFLRVLGRINDVLGDSRSVMN